MKKKNNIIFATKTQQIMKKLKYMYIVSSEISKDTLKIPNSISKITNTNPR